MSVEAGILLFLISIPLYMIVMIVIFWAERSLSEEEKQIKSDDNALIKFLKRLKS